MDGGGSASSEATGGSTPLAGAVRAHRLQARMTQEQLADRSGLSVRTIRGLESGRIQRPHRESLRLLSVALALDQDARARLDDLVSAASSTSRAPARLPYRPVRVVPAQLPPDLPDFAGREADLGRLTRILGARGPAGRHVAVITGQGGLGKTALAVRLAHRLRGVHPDGQLFVDLHGSTRPPATPADVLARILRALGVDDHAIPGQLEARREGYLRLLAERRILVVLDDAADEDQVRPLLPSADGCHALITSRRRLAGLEGSSLELGALSAAEALSLLSSIAGGERIAAERSAAADLAVHCGHLPLAVRIAGARLTSAPHRSVGWLADRLADERRRLDELHAGDLEVRANAALSYQLLAPDDARAFRLLGLLEVPDLAAWSLAALTGNGSESAEAALRRLVDAHLVEVIGADATGTLRYRLHDLLRLYARERAEAEEPPTARRAALLRAAETSLGLADAADDRLPDISSPFAPDRAPRRRLPDPTSAALVADPAAWFEAEHVGLGATIRQLAAMGEDQLAWELAARLVAFHGLREQRDAWRRHHEAALGACRRAGNRRGEAVMLLGLGQAMTESSHERRVQVFAEALSIFRQIGEPTGVCWALYALSVAEDREYGTAAARELAEQTLAAASPLAAAAAARGDGNREAHALMIRSLSLLRLGRTEDARGSLDRLLRVARELGARRAESQALWQLARIWREAGDLGEAELLLERCLTNVEALDDGLGQVRILLDLGRVRGELDQIAAARADLRRAAAISQEIHVRRWQLQAEDALTALETRTR